MSAPLYAVVVARADSQRAADKLADRFAARHDRTFLAQLKSRGDFDRRPYAVIHFTPNADVCVASLESYRIEKGIWHKHQPHVDDAAEE